MIEIKVFRAGGLHLVHTLERLEQEDHVSSRPVSETSWGFMGPSSQLNLKQLKQAIFTGSLANILSG